MSLGVFIEYEIDAHQVILSLTAHVMILFASVLLTDSRLQ